MKVLFEQRIDIFIEYYSDRSATFASLGKKYGVTGTRIRGIRNKELIKIRLRIARGTRGNLNFP
jgi:DNA-directed RNA polymerase sigma subunit (sigma70/sigma32)